MFEKNTINLLNKIIDQDNLNKNLSLNKQDKIFVFKINFYDF